LLLIVCFFSFLHCAPQGGFCPLQHRTVQLLMKIGKYRGFDNKNFSVIHVLQLIDAK